ncbi:Podocan Precursor [Takifugu flavidus]|uniref:Podocan n=1 Tax=Takifugu flavidus TaxID=433684 RepID=A0A5C6MHE5_9TELE|nr:Podocan Precursor [Takifugu flavidus]
MRMASARCSILKTMTVLTLVMGISPTLNTAEEGNKEELNTATVERKYEAMECPSECSCTAEWAVDCAGVDLIEFPTGLSEQTRQLSLQNNKIERILVDHISHLQQLDTLNLQNNMLTTDGGGEEPIICYSWRCRQTHLSATCLRMECPSTSIRVLSHLNGLHAALLEGRTHRIGLPCLLTSAPKFLPPSLVSADFAANHLTRIYPYTFGYKPKLRSVYLHNNELTDTGLPDHMFNGSDNLEILTMSSNFLRVVPRFLPSTLYRLHLKSNKLEEIPVGAFNNLPNLRELYLQNNLLSNEGMDNETFSNLNSLECLDLSNNNLSTVPKGLPRSLVLLHLEKNAIHNIPGDALTSVRNLEYLLLHNNKLRSRSIHPGAFQGLKKLHTLHMYNNLLERVPRGLPRRAKTLMLLHNSITEIGRNDLSLLYTLEELNLSYNKLTSPKSLDLSANQFTHIPSDLPETLEYIYLQRNSISSVSASAFEGTPNIKGIHLRFNRLAVGSMDERTFAHLANLQVLDIGSGNTDLLFNIDKIEGNTKLEEEEDDKDD